MAYLVAFCCTLFQLLIIGSKWAALVCTFFDYHSGDTEMQQRWPDRAWLQLFTVTNMCMCLVI